jgi:hypothetical protein
VTIDDVIVMAQPEAIQMQSELLIKSFQDLGWEINWKKSNIVPASDVTFLGYHINTDTPSGYPEIKIPVDRINRLRKDIRRVLRKQTVCARILARICGQCIAMSKVIIPGKLLLRNAYRLLKHRHTWWDMLSLDNGTISDMSWWLMATEKNGWNNRIINLKPVEAQIETDASATGYGCYYNGLSAAGFWTKWMSLQHSNYREMMAILMGIATFGQFLRGLKVQVLTDNIACVAYINHLGGSSAQLSEIAQAVWQECHTHQIELVAKHLSGSLNTRADSLSRLTGKYEWHLHTKMFQYINNLFGPFTIDRFATMCNTQLPVYNSWTWDPFTSGVDALAQQDWSQHNNYVNPPFRLLPKVLEVIKSQKATATIIAPYWPGQPWFHDMMKLLVRH